jgi:NADPH:quinone reductase-like Zn-dependent oxidoreductase
MKRLAKGEGYGNVYLEEVPVPAPTTRGVVVQAHMSLISRGTEILRRYRLAGPVDPGIMGYSLAGTIAAAGDEARALGFRPGERVFALAPHAEYVAVEVDPDGLYLRRLLPELPRSRAAFQSLAYRAVAWADASQA